MTVEELSARVDKLESRGSEARKDIYKRLANLENESGRIDEKYKNILKELEEQKSQLSSILDRLDELSQKPAKRWDTAMASISSAIIAAVVGFIAAKIKGG